MVNFMTSLSYTSTQRGLVFSLGAGIAFLIQFVVGYLCDKLKTIKVFAIITNIVFAIVVFLFYRNGTSNYTYHLIIGALINVNLKVCAGLIDSWTLEAGDYVKNIYGIIRAYGSIGWAVASLALSYFVGLYGYQFIPVLFAISTAILVAINLCTQDAIKNKAEKVSAKDVKSLLTKKTYLLAICAMFFMFFMSIGNDYIVIDKLNILGATEADVNLNWAIMAIVELPLFFLSNYLLKKYGVVKLLIFAASMYGMRYLLYAFSSNVFTILHISLLQTFTFPVSMCVSKAIIDMETDSNIKSSGQQIALAIYCTGSSLVCPLVVGLLEDNLGVNKAMLCMSCLCIGAITFALLYSKNKKLQVN